MCVWVVCEAWNDSSNFVNSNVPPFVANHCRQVNTPLVTEHFIVRCVDIVVQRTTSNVTRMLSYAFVV